MRLQYKCYAPHCRFYAIKMCSQVRDAFGIPFGNFNLEEEVHPEGHHEAGLTVLDETLKRVVIQLFRTPDDNQKQKMTEIFGVKGNIFLNFSRSGATGGSSCVCPCAITAKFYETVNCLEVEQRMVSGSVLLVRDTA